MDKNVNVLRVLSLNTWTDPERLLERTEAIAQGILKLDPAIACLQEVTSPLVKKLLQQRLSARYHIVSTDHTTLTFPVLAWIPAFLFMIVVGGGLACLSARLSGPIAWVFMVSGAAALSPQGLYYILRFALVRQKGDPLTFGGLFPCIDLMGQCMLVRRGGHAAHSGWFAVETLAVKPFPSRLRGYPLPSTVWQWPSYWMQHCFFRPGCFVVRCRSTRSHEDLLVASAHLVVSAPHTSDNPCRIQQVQFLDRVIKSSLERSIDAVGATTSDGRSGKSNSPCVICCGDFNAPDDAPEVLWMCRDGGYIDTAACSGVVSPHPRFLTWDSALNSNTKSDPGEPDARLDYVFVRQSAGATPASSSDLEINVESVRRVFDGAETPIVSDHFGVLATVMTKRH